MSAKKIILPAVVLVVITGIFFVFSETQKKQETQVQQTSIEALKFSNTQTWDESLWQGAHAATSFTEEQLASISLPPFPANNSQEAQDEIKLLKEYVALRTPEKVAQIVSEFNTVTMVFGSSTLDELVTKQGRTKTGELLSILHEEGGLVILNQKLNFDRVRPSYLDPSLSLAIDLPNHPAYPSGHATQSHLIAHLLSTLDPANEATYFQSAASISRNREIAGVHYPSDSEAGKILAGQLFDLFLEDESFTQLLKEAQNEW